MYGTSMGAAALLAITCLWTATVVRRLPSDLALVRGAAERPEKVAVFAVWGMTGALVCGSIGMVIGALRPVLRWIP
jgi:hypothetical protein